MAGLAALVPAAARADFHIRSPYEIDYGELEIEHNGAAAFDIRPSQAGASSYTLEIGTGLTPWWHTEFEFGAGQDAGPNQPLLLQAAVWENMIQITEPGERWLDTGFYFEYGQSLTRGQHAGPNELTFGPIASKQIGQFVHTINLFVTRELGPNQTTSGLDFSYAWQSKWQVWAPLSPALEIYGDTGVLGSVPKFNQQQLLLGPVAVGEMHLHDLGLGNAGKIKYELGWLFGATSETPRGVLKWRLELEVPF